jgi:hypothetical protein
MSDPSAHQDGSQRSANDPSSANQPSDFDKVVNLLQQALQQGVQLGASTGRGPSLRDLPKDAFKLPTFKGSLTGSDKVRPSEVLTFLNRLDKYFNIYTSVITTDSVRLDVIVSCFPERSRAATWYNTQRKRISSSAEFRTAFIEYFGGDASEDRALRSRILSFRQREQDSVTDYYAAFCLLIDDIHALVEFLHKNQQSFLYDEYTQADMFVHGLRSPVREEVERIHSRNPTFTLEDLFREAVLEEKHARRKPRGFDHNKNPNQNARSERVRLNAMNGKPKWHGGCFFCGTFDHKHEDCEKIARKKAKGLWKDNPPKKS